MTVKAFPWLNRKLCCFASVAETAVVLHADIGDVPEGAPDNLEDNEVLRIGQQWDAEEQWRLQDDSQEQEREVAGMQQV